MSLTKFLVLSVRLEKSSVRCYIIPKDFMLIVFYSAVPGGSGEPLHLGTSFPVHVNSAVSRWPET